MSRVVVIGGGFAGLVSAAYLAKDGHDVTLVEKQERLGGRAGLWQRDGFSFDTGPSWFLMREVFEHSYKLLGTSLEAELELTRLDPAYRVYLEGEAEAFEVSGDYRLTRQRFEARQAGAGAALDSYVASASEATALAEDYFLWNRFDTPINLLGKGIAKSAPRLGQLLFQSLEKFVGGRFTDALIQRVLSYPAVFLGTRPEKAPALYHLMSHFDLKQGVFYPRGGFAEVVNSFERLARRYGVDIRTNTSATEIVVDTAGRKKPIVKAVRANGPDGQVNLAADHVVLACDQGSMLGKLIPQIADKVEEQWESAEPGPGAILVLLGIRGRVPELTHHTLLFTQDWKTNFDTVFNDRLVPSPASFYVCAPSVTDPTVAPAETENLFLLIPTGANPQIGAGGIDGTGAPEIEAAANAAIAQLAEAIAVPDLAQRIIVRRTIGPLDMEQDLNAWRGSALGPAHTLKQSAFFRGSVKSPHVEELFTVGSSSVPGIGVPMCLISAEILLKYARGDTSAGPLPEPEQQI